MGNVNAAAMAEAVGEGQIGLRSALAWHLTSNHFPPLPVSFIEPALAAIDAAVDEDWDRDIELPEGITWHDQPSAPATALVDHLHLHFYVEAAMYTDDEADEFGEEEL